MFQLSGFFLNFKHLHPYIHLADPDEHAGMAGLGLKVWVLGSRR